MEKYALLEWLQEQIDAEYERHNACILEFEQLKYKVLKEDD